MLSLIGGLLPLAVIVAIVAAVVAARRGRHDEATGEDPADPGIGTVRRLFLYGLALVALIFTGVGLSMLIGGALDSAFGALVVSEHHQQLAIALAFTFVGAPAWLAFATLAQRSVAQHPAERRSQLRRLYLVLARGIALTIVVANAVAVGQMLLGVADRAGSPWGWLAAWSAAWAIHERVARTEPPPTAATRLLERLLLYYGALLGLALTLGGAVASLQAPLAAVYDRAFRVTIVEYGWSESLRQGLVVLAVGAATWSWHWLRGLARRDGGTDLWYVQVFLFGILSGVALVVIPAATILYAVLQWTVGVPGAEEAAAHFAFTPGAASALLVGLATWAYHRALVAETTPGQRERRGPERVYRYLVAAAGLATAAAGLATVFALASDALGGAGGELLRVQDWWRNQLVSGVTLLVVGVPLWGYEWRAAQRAAASGDPALEREERTSSTRRIFLFGAVGIDVLALLISLTVVLYQLFQAVLDGDLTRAVLHDGRWGIAIALTAGAVGGYHLLVLREDQRALAAAGPAPAAPPPAAPAGATVREVVVLGAGPAAEAAAAALATLPGARVRAWRPREAAPVVRPLGEQELARLVERVTAMPAGGVLVSVAESGLDVLAFTDEPVAEPAPGDR